MTMTRPQLALMLAVAAAATGLSGLVPAAAPSAVVAVEPAELTKRPELVGREVSVDDRIALFLNHAGRDFDEITLKRTPVVFRLPTRLRYKQHPGASVARIQGVLTRDGDRLACDVTAIELLPKDLDRLNRGVAVLPAGEFVRRAAWAAWAERRGKDFQDDVLRKRAREIEADAIRIESEHEGADPAGHWLALARRARDHGVPEPEPSAIAHRAFRVRAAKAKSAEDLASLIADVAAFLPASATPAPPPADFARWEAPYARDPAAAYRAAPPAVRKTLDRRLWADASQRLLELRASAAPQEALTLADQAKDQLPDRPELALRLLDQGLSAATAQVGNLRLGEVKSLADVYRSRLDQPDRARALLRNWLEEQRTRHLSPTDAEGRVALATQYEDLIGDKSAAVDLLQSAWKIDPESRELADAFRRRGFRKVNDEWVDPTQAGRGRAPSPSVSATAPATAQGPTRRLLNLSPNEVKALMGGKPNRIIASIAQGQVVEQWIYFGATQNQYVNFLRTAGEGTGRVIGYYSLARPHGSDHP